MLWWQLWESRVVLYLILNPQQRVAVLLNSVLNSAVPLLCNPEIKPQFKVLILVSSNNIVAFALQVQRSIRIEFPALFNVLAVGKHPLR